MNSINVNPLQSASAAISRGVARLSQDAATVAASSISDSGELLPALLDARQQVLYTQAAAKMLTTADEMMGSLVDITA